MIKNFKKAISQKQKSGSCYLVHALIWSSISSICRPIVASIRSSTWGAQNNKLNSNSNIDVQPKLKMFNWKFQGMSKIEDNIKAILISN